MTTANNNYHQLATLMGNHPRAAIFRRFSIENAKNLLVMEAEIMTLSYELGHEVQRDRMVDERKELEKYIFDLKAYREGSEESIQWKLLKDLRGLLREYNEALLQFEAISKLPHADKTNLQALQNWLSHPAAGSNFLTGYEKGTWSFEQDLISLAGAEGNKDPISKWIDSRLLPYYYNRIGYRSKKHTISLHDPTLTKTPTETGVTLYPESTAIATTISTVFASTLPTLPMFPLYYIKSPVVRLVLVVVFTSLFSLIITVVGGAKRSECFAATAAVAAVLVVFVGSTDTNQCTCPST